MPRTTRNQGEVLFGVVKLENRDYLASELIPIVGRNKRRILSLCEELGLGKKISPIGSGCPVRVLKRKEVEAILKWFDNNGRKHWEAPWTEKAKTPAQRSKKQAV